MAKTISKVSLEQMPNELQKIIMQYTKGLKEEVNKVVEDSAVKLIEEIKITAPVSKLRNDEIHLKDSFTYTPLNVSNQYKVYKIWSPKKYWLVHLAEFGHFNYTKNKTKFIQPQPFLIPAYDKVTKKMYEDILNKISKGGS